MALGSLIGSRQRMKAAGFQSVALGEDGPEAWQRACELNDSWQATRLAEKNGKADPNARGSDQGYVYFLKVGERLKIGFSRKLQDRVADLSTGISQHPDLLMAVRGSRAEEQALHRRLAAYRVRGEWFTASPAVMRTAMRSLMFGRPMHDGVSDLPERIEPKSLTA